MSQYRRLKAENIMFRPGNADDVAFIFRRTLVDLRQSDFNTGMPNATYYTYAHREWEHTLTRGIVRVAYQGPYEKDGATVSGNTRYIIGFVVCDVTNIGLVVHYCYVRQDMSDEGKTLKSFRRQGIATRMIEGLMQDYDLKRVIYTQRTQMFRRYPKFRERIDQDARLEYNPRLFYTLLPPGWETGVVPILDSHIAPQLREMQGQWTPP